MKMALLYFDIGTFPIKFGFIRINDVSYPDIGARARSLDEMLEGDYSSGEWIRRF